LNVFTVAATSFAGTTSYSFNVPYGSSVIINVTGTSATIANAGFSGPYMASNLLWNFPAANSLTITSVSFPGSILATQAQANLSNGNNYGTIVVGSAATTNQELYSAPYRVPSAATIAQAQQNIKHVVVIMQENRSFDHYFGTYNGANGVSNVPASSRSVTNFKCTNSSGPSNTYTLHTAVGRTDGTVTIDPSHVLAAA